MTPGPGSVARLTDATLEWETYDEWAASLAEAAAAPPRKKRPLIPACKPDSTTRGYQAHELYTPRPHVAAALVFFDELLHLALQTGQTVAAARYCESFVAVAGSLSLPACLGAHVQLGAMRLFHKAAEDLSSAAAVAGQEDGAGDAHRAAAREAATSARANAQRAGIEAHHVLRDLLCDLPAAAALEVELRELAAAGSDHHGAAAPNASPTRKARQQGDAASRKPAEL